MNAKARRAAFVHEPVELAKPVPAAIPVPSFA